MMKVLTMVAALNLLAAAASAQQGAPPDLGVYVTEQNKDAFVAIYGNKALELTDCTTQTQARTLLGLPSSELARPLTLSSLQSDFGYGTWPKLPCDPAKYDSYWPASTAIWADIEGSGNYFLAASGGGYFALPAACAGLKSALAIRQRLQLPRVLQALSAPPDLGEPRLIITCGKGADMPGAIQTPQSTSQGGWSLHKFDTFLTPQSTTDTIYVARFSPPGPDAAPSFLPIIRVNGRPTSEAILQAGDEAATMEKALRQLLGISADSPVTQLGGEAVSAVRLAPYVDLCTADCASYSFAHKAFLRPAEDLGVSSLPAPAVSSLIDPFGFDQLIWPFAEAREARFTACPALTAAMGLKAGAAPDWFQATSASGDAGNAAGRAFSCVLSQPGTCTRRVEPGGELAQALLAAGADCPAAEHLRIELPAATKSAQGLLLQNLQFKSVEFRPAPGVARASLTIQPAHITVSSAACVLSQANALMVASGLPRLELHQIDLHRPTSDAAEVLALQVDGGKLVLDDASIGLDAEGTAPVSRGVNLCMAELYAVNSKINAEAIVVQALSSKVMVTGTAEAGAELAKARYGLLLSPGSKGQLNFVNIASANPIVLRGATVVGKSVSLRPSNTSSNEGSAIMLERLSSAQFLTSRISGFRCAASFVDAASRVELRLPGNDIAADNTNRACGPGQFNLVE